MATLEYDSNNSGGSWWLSDDDWRNLEKAGWTVEWKEGRWLGALATKAHKEFSDPDDGIVEWERITCQRSTDQGCGCCGPPHGFSVTRDDGSWSYRSVYPTGYQSTWE